MFTKDTISALLAPRPIKSPSRKLWSIDLDTLVGFFTATNVEKTTFIPNAALGCPVRLQREADGTPKFRNGKPVYHIAAPLRDHVKLLRENLIANMQLHTQMVRELHPKEYQAELEANAREGNPIAAREAEDLAKVYFPQAEEAVKA